MNASGRIKRPVSAFLVVAEVLFLLTSMHSINAFLPLYPPLSTSHHHRTWAVSSQFPLQGGKSTTRLADTRGATEKHGAVSAAATTSTVQQATAGSSSNNSNNSAWDTLLKRFQGDFDNYNQVVQDRANGLLPKEGGGHEHIHCCLVPVSADSRLAAFYFDGQPRAIFRFRFYQLVPLEEKENELGAVDTVLHTLHPELEKQLRKCEDPMEWPDVFEKFPVQGRVQLLQKCDVRWSYTMDPVLHSYATEYASLSKDVGLHAVMVYGQALVESQMMPGQKILIKDQLSLWEDELWIHDRGFNPDTMEYIYGNQRGRPYRLERVSNICQAGPERIITNESLSWTLGALYRTETQYQQKLDQVGGPSIPKR